LLVVDVHIIYGNGKLVVVGNIALNFNEFAYPAPYWYYAKKTIQII